jgi:excisionase family DNA binding protein
MRLQGWIGKETENGRSGGEVWMDELLSIPEVAHQLGGISVWTVRAWLSQGRLRRTKVGGRTMVRQSELQKVITDGLTPKVAESATQIAALKPRATS